MIVKFVLTQFKLDPYSSLNKTSFPKLDMTSRNKNEKVKILQEVISTPISILPYVALLILLRLRDNTLPKSFLKKSSV